MRLDHIAYRVRDRSAAILMLKVLMDYEVVEYFDLQFDDGTTCECAALIPPEKRHNLTVPWSAGYACATYHMAPEIFVSEGAPDSIVYDWVERRNGGGIHHKAYMVDDIEETVKQWKHNGIEFSSDIIDCPEDDLRQIFTKPLNTLGGIILELIERGTKGFCRSSVRKLMESTHDKDT